jgi:hypothetical protein
VSKDGDHARDNDARVRVIIGDEDSPLDGWFLIIDLHARLDCAESE